MSSSKKKKQRDLSEQEPDEHFAFIAGYTAGGFPYGITWEEMEQIHKEKRADLNNDEEFPFR